MKWHRNYFHLLSSRSHIGCCFTRASPNCLSTFSWKLTLRDFIFCLGAKVINIMGKMFQNWCKGTVAHANSNQTGHCFYFPDCTSFLIVHTTVLDPPFGSSAACSVIFFLRTDGPHFSQRVLSVFVCKRIGSSISLFRDRNRGTEVPYGSVALVHFSFAPVLILSHMFSVPAFSTFMTIDGQ